MESWIVQGNFAWSELEEYQKKPTTKTSDEPIPRTYHNSCKVVRIRGKCGPYESGILAKFFVYNLMKSPRHYS